MKLDEIRGLNEADARARLLELQDEQFRLRFRGATETLESPLRLREVRRDIARVLTVLRERERETAATPAKVATKKSTAKTASTKTASKRAAKTAGTKTAR